MKCSIAKRNITAYVDGVVLGEERREMALHLGACATCADAVERHTRVREAVRVLPKPLIPGDVSLRLRMLASRERNIRIGLGRTSWQRFTGRLNEFLRPLAVPLAGGVCAALLLFASLVPTLSQARIVYANDVPCTVFTQPTLENIGPIGFAPADAVVDLRIDDQGRLVNYSIVETAGHVDAIHRSIENSLLFTRFSPAHLAPNSCPDCAVAIAGTIRMVFRSSHIEVKG